MYSLTLPEESQARFDAIRKTLAKFKITERLYRLGGGTGLGMYWGGHRQSTDLDLFFVNRTMSRVRPILDKHNNELREALQDALGEPVEMQPTGFTVKNEKGPSVSLWEQGDGGHETRHEAQVRGSSVQLQSVAEILYWKVSARILEKAQFVQRDFYDITAANSLEPEAWRRMRRWLTPNMRDACRETVKELQPFEGKDGWHRLKRPQDRGLEQPRLPKWLAREPERAVAESRRLFEDLTKYLEKVAHQQRRRGRHRDGSGLGA